MTKISSVELKYLLQKLSQKPASYVQKQVRNIELFGKTREYPNVSSDILDKYTPFRRLSKQKCSLSDSEYFIKKFEKEYAVEIPIKWTKMSEAEKVDFIVKNRYEKLLSNKIMNDIKNSRVEKSFILSTDGKIKYSGTYNSSTHTPMPEELATDSVCIHNHPVQFVQNSVWSYSELPQVNANARPHSISDMVHAIRRSVKKSYVVDSKGNKFCFLPSNKYIGNREGYCDNLHKDLSLIQRDAFNGNCSIEEAFRKNYSKGIKRVRADGHIFKILNFFDNFDKF